MLSHAVPHPLNCMRKPRLLSRIDGKTLLRPSNRSPSAANRCHNRQITNGVVLKNPNAQDRADNRDDLRYVTVRPEFAQALQALERLSFPTINPRDLTSVKSVEMQCEKFPEGGFVVLDGEDVVGFAMGIFVDFDLDHPKHHIDEAVGPNGSDFHDPNGEWYYGTDIAVSPAYRGRGIGRKLYELRKQLVRDHNRAGIIAGGVIPGYADHKSEMSADEYIEKVVAGELFDSTLSFQLANGFEARGAIEGYMTDSAVDDWASFIVWLNLDHDPEAFRRAKSTATDTVTS